MNVYPKSFLSDRYLNFDYLTDKRNYNPIGQRRSIFHPSRMFFVLPLYISSKNKESLTSLHHYLFRFFGCLVLLKLGFEVGKFEAEESNKKLRESKLVEYESED